MGEKEQPCREYVDLKGEESSVVHWGQMKLLLGEIEFLTPYIHIPDITIVYVGSSPGHHLPALVNLMPSTWTWDLYDSRPCEVYHSDDQPLLEKVAMPSKRSVLVGEEVKVANEAADSAWQSCRRRRRFRQKGSTRCAAGRRFPGKRFKRPRISRSESVV